MFEIHHSFMNRIPGDAIIVFDVEMVGLPGKEPELIELIGDD